MACYISNIKVKKHIQSIKDSHERGNIGENPGIMRIEKPLKIIKKNSIKDSAFRMALTVYPCHSSRDNS